MLRSLDRLTPTDADPARIVQRYLERIQSTPNIHLYTGATLKQDQAPPT
jgi:hypothetical protein